MRPEHKVIIGELTSYLIAHPEIRFCQALRNLDINVQEEVFGDNFIVQTIKDNFYDTDQEVLQRINDAVK